MKLSIRKGFSFGLTSGIITTLGLLIGLYTSTHSKMVVLGGILTIAVADAMSDALGIHVSEEAENKHSEKEIWESTWYTFITKFIFALSFAIPVILLDIKLAVYVSIVWGLALLSSLSYYIARKTKQKAYNVITEHLVVALVVIVLTYLLGKFISSVFV
jgi:VIT1/CCC1 family predicted Fe2+/Mn2+ transporter